MGFSFSSRASRFTVAVCKLLFLFWRHYKTFLVSYYKQLGSYTSKDCTVASTVDCNAYANSLELVLLVGTSLAVAVNEFNVLVLVYE